MNPPPPPTHTHTYTQETPPFYKSIFFISEVLTLYKEGGQLYGYLQAVHLN